MIGGFWKIPEALKSAIAGHDFGTIFATERRTHLFVQSEKFQSVKCFVVPLQETPLSGTRRVSAHNWMIGIWLIEQVASATPAEKQAREDELLTLVDEIREFVEGMESLAVEDVNYPIRLVNEPRLPVDHDAYREAKVFLGAISVEVIDQ